MLHTKFLSFRKSGGYFLLTNVVAEKTSTYLYHISTYLSWKQFYMASIKPYKLFLISFYGLLNLAKTVIFSSVWKNVISHQMFSNSNKDFDFCLPYYILVSTWGHSWRIFRHMSGMNKSNWFWRIHLLKFPALKWNIIQFFSLCHISIQRTT